MPANYCLRDLNISTSDGEKEVKKYACTYLKSKIIGLQASGTLAVTNKRVIFKASGSSTGGQSIFQSETPLEDISGISVYKGTYFNIKYLVAGIVIFIIGLIVWPIIINFISFDNEKALKIELWISAIVSSIVLFTSPNKVIFKSVLGLITFSSFCLIASPNLNNQFKGNFEMLLDSDRNNTNMKWVWVLAFAAIIAIIYFVVISCRRETMSLSIGSKGGSNTPIFIAGVSSWSVSNNAAFKAITAEPDIDAETMIKELGALILDLQHKGDYGIENWANQTSTLSNKPRKVEVKGDTWVCPKCKSINDKLSQYCKECGTYK